MADYTTQDKLIAIGLVERNGGSITKHVLAEVRNLLNAPSLNKSTVYRWWMARAGLQPVATETPFFKDANSQPAPDLGNQDWVDATLKHYFAKTALVYLERALNEDVVKATKGKDAVMTAAIATDKMRLLLNLPTEIVIMLPDVLAAIQRANLQASDVFNQIISQLAESNHD